MKTTIKLVLSAVLGSLLTYGIIMYTVPGFSEKPIEISHVAKAPVSNVGYMDSVNGTAVPLDFSAVASEVTPSVVHIRSTIVTEANNMNRYRNRRLPDPFRDFFGEDFFDQFLNPNQDGSGQNQPREFRQQGTGSGVIINENGYIVTNNHVIQDADEIEVALFDNGTYPAKVIGTDPYTDLALIKIEAKNLKPLSLVDSDNVKVGEWVLAVGNPFNLNSTVTAGIISAKGRNIDILRDRYAIESFIQTDAAINPGNSGGALVNMEGGLIGINTAIASPTGTYAGYGFAVPSNMVNKIVEDLLKYGEVQRGYLGVTIRTLDGNLAKEKSLELKKGVYIDSVADNSAAEEAGVKPGDVIVGVDNYEISTAPQLQEVIARYNPGDRIDLKLNRAGNAKDLKVVLKNLNGEAKITRKEYSKPLMSLGAEFEEIDKKTAKKLGIYGGVKITRIYPGILKRNTDIREGFIITKVDKEPVTTIDKFSDVLNKKEGGMLIEGIYEDRPGTHYYGLGLSS